MKPLHRGTAMWALLVLAACSGGDGSPTTTPVDPPAAVEPTLVLSPTAYTLEALGDTVRLQAMLATGNAAPVAASQVTWTALDPEVATVDDEGRVRSLSPGDARVLASTRGKTDTARIRVTQSVAILTVEPANPSVTVDATLQMRALAYDRKGAPVTGLQIDWTSSDAAVAPVTSDGSVYAKTAGTATVTARVGDKTASTSVAVTAAVPVVAAITLSPANPTVQVGATVQMQTVVQDAAGRPIGVDQAWSSSNPAVASVSAEGLVTGRAAGIATVTVAAGGKSVSTPVTVPAPPPVVGSIALTPANPTVAIGATQQMQAEVRDTEGGTMSGVPLSWGSSNEGVASVSPSGVVTAKAAGTANVVVTGGGKTISTVVTVPAPPPVATTITLTPANPTLAIGATQQMQAVVRDQNGAVMIGVALTWATTNSGVAYVSTSGLVEARGAGTATVSVTGGGKSASTVVTVPAPAVASIALTPASPTVAIGASQQMQAVARDAGGATIAGVAWTWSSSNETVAAVSSAGYVFGKAGGTATITVAGGGKSAATVVTVPAPAPAPPPTAPANLLSHNFDDGTLGGFVYPYTQYPNDMAVVADPTGAGKGKVVRFHYLRSDLTQGHDRNRHIRWRPATGFGHGSTFFFRGEFNLGTLKGAERDQRKLLYWQQTPTATSQFFSVVSVWGTGLRFEGGAVGYTKTVGGLATINPSTWYVLEQQVTVNSAPDRADGVLRIWLNGRLVHEDTTMRWIPAAGDAFGLFMIGDQVNSSSLYDEYRYWDNVGFSTRRIAP